MRTKSIFNISFMLVIFIYQLFGKGVDCELTPEQIRWGRIFYIPLYAYITYFNINDLKRCIITIHKHVTWGAVICFGIFTVTDAICFIWTDLYYVIIAKTHLWLSGSLLIWFILVVLALWRPIKKLILLILKLIKR